MAIYAVRQFGKRGANVVRRTTFTPNAPWRKHGTDRQQRPAEGMCAAPAVGTSEARVSMLHRRAGRVIDLRFVR